jgi:hypothetical protein
MKNDACCLTPPKGIKVCAGSALVPRFRSCDGTGRVSLLSRRTGATFIGLPLSISKPSGVTTFAGKTLNPSQGRLDVRRDRVRGQHHWLPSGAALEINSEDIPERFSLFFRTDGTRIPCHVVWRQDEQVGVVFD